MPLKMSLDSLDGLSDEIKALYTEKNGKFTLGVEGVEDVSGLKSALAKTREEKDALMKSLKGFDGIDPEKFKALSAQIESSEELKLITEGKFTEVLDRRTAKFQEELNKQLAAAHAERDAALKRGEKYETRVLDGQILAAAAKAGVDKVAFEDALFRGRSVFKLDDAGNAVQFGDDGKPVVGKDGKTLFSPDEWAGGLKEIAPHWFPNGNTGSGNGNAGGANSKTITRAQYDKMSPEEQSSKVRTGGFTVVD